MDSGGGDGFDLDDLSDADPFSVGCSTVVRDSILSNGFVYLRLVNAITRENPDISSQDFPGSPDSFDHAPDVDGVLARYIIGR